MLFVIRVKGTVTITAKNGNRMNLRTRGKRLVANIPQWYEQILYRSDRIVSGLNLAAVVAPVEAEGTDDPWFLVTNLRKAETTIHQYTKRFYIRRMV